MASTITQERKSRKYYHTHEKYRKKKIARETSKHKNNKSKYAKEQRDYYHSSEDYRKYKRRYAREYRKEHPTKAKAKKYR